VGVIPEDWAISPLVELIDESRSIRYGIVQPGKFDPTGRYMVRGQDYSKGWVSPSDLFRVSPQVEEPFKNARVQCGDFIITIVGAGTGHVEVIPHWLDGANLTQTTARLAISPAKAFSDFCKFYLQSEPGKRQVANYLKGAAQPGLNCGDIEKFRIPLPPLPEQTAIAEVLTEMDAGLEQRREKTRALKQAMMQELLTGKTRLV
jgi:type I restriction enzyme S subunit